MLSALPGHGGAGLLGPAATYLDGGPCRGRFSRAAQFAPVVKITTWCWVAIADGQFDAVTVHSRTASIRRRLSRGRHDAEPGARH
jgi:hypothetical protein